jgi:hypothetical protein
MRMPIIAITGRRKNVRQIAQEARISFRDIAAILKKKETTAVNGDGSGNGNGIRVAMDNQQQQLGIGSSQSNQKSTQAYKLFSEAKKPIELAIELNLREGQVNKFFREFWKLKRQYRLYQLYPQIEPSLASFLKLHETLKKRGLNPDNVEWFVALIELSVVKLPELQDEYRQLEGKTRGLQYNFQDMQYKNQESERYLQYLQQRIMEQTDAVNTLQQTFDTSAEKVSNL